MTNTTSADSLTLTIAPAGDLAKTSTRWDVWPVAAGRVQAPEGQGLSYTDACDHALDLRDDGIPAVVLAPERSPRWMVENLAKSWGLLA
jgi:hypothetical protein